MIIENNGNSTMNRVMNSNDHDDTDDENIVI